MTAVSPSEPAGPAGSADPADQVTAPVAGLTPVLGVKAAILLTISCITPASSLFIIVPTLLASQGSGVVLTILAGVLVSVGVGACYAELGTRTPSSGGEYAMVTHTLGRRLGWLTFVLTCATLVVIPPVIARAVFGSLFIGSLIIVIPTAATVLGVADLRDLATGTFPDFVTAWGGSRVSAAISVGIAVAILNAVIVMVLQNGRVIYASARDRAWPDAVNRRLSRLHPRFNSPVAATLVISLPGALLAYLVDIESLLGVTSVTVSAVYLLLAFGGLAVRRTQHQGWRMPLWPLPPVLVVLGVGYALLESARSDLLVVGGIVLAALAYDQLYLQPRRDTHFVVDAKEDR